MKTLQPRPGVLSGHLARLPVLGDLAPADRARLAEACSLRLYDRGERLFERGEPALALHALVHGGVRVLRPGPAGREKVLHLHQAPALIAEVPVLMGIPFPASAECCEPCTVLALPRPALLELFRGDQDLAIRMLGAAMARLHELTASLAMHGEKSAVARVASFLLGLASAQGGRATLPAPKKDVACYLGLQPESLSRALAALRADGAIEVEEQEIRVLDRGRLEGALGEG